MAVVGLTKRRFQRPNGAQPPRPGTTGAAAQLVPGALVLILWLSVIPPSGGYFPRSWYPAALGSVLFFCTLCVAWRSPLPSTRAARRSIALFAGLVTWAFLSMIWAGSPADAWETADQLLLYLTAAAIAALVPWTPRTLALVAGLWSLGVAVLCAGRLITWLGARDLLTFFSPEGRLYDPMGYPNATAALPAIALFPALALSALREIPVWARAAALAVALFLAEFAVLPVSRGAILGVLVALPFVIAAAPDRWRLLGRLLAVAALMAPALSSLLAFGNAPGDGKDPVTPLHHAATWMITTVVLALLVGGLLGLLDDRVRAPRITRRGVGVALALVAVAVAAAGVAYGPRGVRYVRDTWNAAGTPGSGTGGRLLSLAPEERPDYARVSVKAFGKHPIGGLGAGNFSREYDAHRKFDKHSRYPHNLVLRAAGEGGIVGLGLFGALVASLAVGLVAARKRLGATGRALVAGSAGMGVYFLAHGELDWLEAFPSLVMPVTGLAFAVLVLPGAGLAPRTWARPAWLRPVALGLGGALLGAVIVALGAPYVSERYIERARSTWTAAPTAAFDDLDRAASWNPLSPAP